MIRGMIKFVFDTIKSLIFVLVILALFLFVIGIKKCKDTYMKPTIQKNDYIMIDKLSYRFKDIKRGDIVTYFYKNPSYLFGRIVGLPGEKIEFIGGKLYVNDEHIDEYYLSKENTEDFSIEKVPDDEYLILSDNRLHSFDSRDETVGTIAKSDIAGKVIFRVWPLKKIGTIKNND